MQASAKAPITRVIDTHRRPLWRTGGFTLFHQSQNREGMLSYQEA